ncbi:MAG TPA: nucleotidyl transferase AbiEii/AbiGii toxin family protein [Solirubrobacteraceae bacterium]|nr:nucleotidyl transferase AbiEii/AbiGii toxin family protein [Solirubrobacteraceae bacterium]
MAAEQRYKTPAALRRALTDKLKAKAAHSRWSLEQLQRQMAYDRLLERLYFMDEEWILKGAAALLARGLGVRASIDIDVYRAKAADVAEIEVREAAAIDLGDWFRFEIGARKPIADGSKGIRLPVRAYVGATVWVAFHIDVVGAGIEMTGVPEDVPALARISMPDVSQRGYRAYPLVDHVADKVVATFQRYGDHERPSTRYRDLVDLVSIVTGATVEAEAQMAALASEANRRGVELLTKFSVPDRRLWDAGYAKEAARSLLPAAQTLDEALDVLRPFLDPLLDGTAAGRWDYASGGWVDG